MVRILFARHGQTDYNVDERICGISDARLTPEGVKQAKRLGQRLAGEYKVDVILSSPINRAKDTAELINGYVKAPLMVEKRLSEWDYGNYEGKFLRDVPEFQAAKLEFGVAMGESGESVLKLAHRVYSLIEDIKARYDGKTVLCVCHGGVIRAAKTYFENMTMKQFSECFPQNGEIYEYRV